LIRVKLESPHGSIVRQTLLPRDRLKILNGEHQTTHANRMIADYRYSESAACAASQEEKFERRVSPWRLQLPPTRWLSLSISARDIRACCLSSRGRKGREAEGPPVCFLGRLRLSERRASCARRCRGRKYSPPGSCIFISGGRTRRGTRGRNNGRGFRRDT